MISLQNDRKRAVFLVMVKRILKNKEIAECASTDLDELYEVSLWQLVRYLSVLL